MHEVFNRNYGTGWIMSNDEKADFVDEDGIYHVPDGEFDPRDVCSERFGFVPDKSNQILNQ